MYKVLMVDDEPMALEVLKYVIDWKGLGFSICDTCSNGEEASCSIDKYQPDVVITDIRMPVMDGLALIRYAKEHGHENIKFIVVSGYGEFEYAKKAMQYGVKYYLQKPILNEDIYEVITEVKKQLEKIRIGKETEKMDKRAVLYGILGAFLRGNDSQKAFQFLKSFIDESTLLMGWNCIIVELESSGQTDNDKFKEARFTAREAIDKAVEGNSSVFILEQSLNTFIILMSLKDENKVRYMAKRIHENLLSNVLSGFTVGIGENVLGINNIKHSYAAAEEALKYRFYRGLNCLIFYNEIKKETFNFEFNDFFMSNKILEAIEEFDQSKVKSIIDTTFEYFKVHRIHPDIVIMFVSNMISKINNFLYESNSKKVDNFTGNHTVLEIKNHERTMEKLKKFFWDFCMDCCKYLKKEHYKKAGNNTEKIEEFIKTNYKRNITIRELAEKIYMHPAYLGQLFVQKFGVSFNEYIHQLRIEEAKRLMNVSNLKNHEIARELGYSNYNSFLQQFQKYTGMKPTKFRSTLK